jgi:hypothetical protein
MPRLPTSYGVARSGRRLLSNGKELCHACYATDALRRAEQALLPIDGPAADMLRGKVI